MGRAHSQGVFSPAQSEKAESWPPRVSGSQISPQDCSAVFCVLCILVQPERGWLFCDEKSPTGGGRPGEPRVRGVTASMAGSGRFGGKGKLVAYPRLGASVALGIDPDVLRGKGSVSSDAENGQGLLDCSPLP